MKSYKTITNNALAKIVKKKSEFIAHISPAKTEEDALAFLEKIRSLHRKANHNVFAYSLHKDSRTRYSDDGEPTKTAGLPVHNVLVHAEITDCIIVVTRYFGGTLLGTGGLVHAYTDAAKAVLSASKILLVQPCIDIEITVEYPLYEQLLRLLAEFCAKNINAKFTHNIQICATMLSGTENLLVDKLNELCSGKSKYTLSKVFFAPF